MGFDTRSANLDPMKSKATRSAIVTTVLTTKTYFQKFLEYVQSGGFCHVQFMRVRSAA